MTVHASAAVSWCPRCQADSLSEVGKTCLFCDAVVVAPPGARTPRGKPRGKHAKVTDAQLELLYRRAYLGKNLSVRRIAEATWEKLGYKNARSCAGGLEYLFRDRGYQLRDRIEATRLASTTNGLSPRDWQTRKARRKRAGKTGKGKEFRPLCRATKTQAPGKGKPCTHRTIAGSAYCYHHEPARHADVLAAAKRMRARLPKRATVAWADVHAELAPWLAQQPHPMTALARATGVPNGTCSRLLLGRSETITEALAARLRAALNHEGASA